MRPSGPDWTPQRRWEEQRPWRPDDDDDDLEPIDLLRLRRALRLDFEYLGSNQFVVASPNATHAAQRRLVNFHPRRPLVTPPCACADWRRGELCVHVLCVLLHVGDRDVLQALRQLVPVVEER